MSDFHISLRRNNKLLSRCLVVSPELLFELKSVDYMREKVPQIRQQTTPSLKIAELLNILDEVPGSQRQTVYSAFMLALRQDGQEHVANIFHPESDARPMSDEHYQLLQDRSDELMQFINPTSALLCRLVRDGIFNRNDNESVESKTNYSEMSKEVIHIMQYKPDIAFGRFIEALKANDQYHVVYILTGKGGERPLSRVRRKVLIKARESLVRKVEIIHSTLVAKLISTGVLNEVDKLQIEAKQSSEDKTGVLIDAIARKSDLAYNGFIQALKHQDIGQLQVAEALEGLELKGILEAKFKDYVQDSERSKIVQVVRDKMRALVSGYGDGIETLTRLIEDNGFAVSDVTEGSIHISFRCFTEESLGNLKQLYTDKTLDRLFTEVFCLEFVEQGLESLELVITDGDFDKCVETFRQWKAETSQELLELVLLYAFVALFNDYYKSHYKTDEAIQPAYCTLAGVCYNWWQTMDGWPQSPTKHWFKHKLIRAVNHACRPYVVSPRLQFSLSFAGPVSGVTQCDSKLFILCQNSVHVFGPNNEQLGNIELKQLYYPSDIVSCTETQQLYIADGSRDSAISSVWRVSLDGRHVAQFLPDNSTTTTTTTTQFRPRTLSVTSRRLLVTLYNNTKIFVYGADGVELKCVPLSDMTSLHHAVETSRGTFIVSHLQPQPRVCEVNADGHVARVYCDQQQLSFPAYLSLDSNGRIFVADYNKHRVLLLNSETLELERVLLDEQQLQLTLYPWRLCCTEQTRQFAVTSWLSGCVHLFKVQ